MPTKPDSQTVRRRLTKIQAELRVLAQSSSDARKPVELDQSRIGRLSRMDAMRDQAMALEIARRRDIELARIDAALTRFDDGEYGECLTCGEDIAPKRLALDPATPVCIGCASAR
jgi:DnaK suppressor protein